MWMFICWLWLCSISNIPVKSSGLGSQWLHLILGTSYILGIYPYWNAKAPCIYAHPYSQQVQHFRFSKPKPYNHWNAIHRTHNTQYPEPKTKTKDPETVLA